MKCFNCNRLSIKGNSRSFSNKANIRRFKINLQTLNIYKIFLYNVNNNKEKIDKPFKKKISLCVTCLRFFKDKIFYNFNKKFYNKIIKDININY